MDKQMWLGVDLGKDSFEAALASLADPPENWASLPHCAFSFDEEGLRAAVQWVDQSVGLGSLSGVCLESTGRLGWIWMEQMNGRLGPVSMVNPVRPKRFGEGMGLRDKNDRIDACVLALYAATMRPRQTSLPAPALKELRELNRLFSALSVDRQAYGQRLNEASSGLVARQIKLTVQNLENRMRALQARMEELLAEPSVAEDARHIVSIKGVGCRTACVLLAELGDLRQYTRAEIASLAGVYPREFTSGTSVHKRGRMAKRGGGAIRKTLYVCAMSAIRFNPQMKAFYQRLIGRGKCKMVALGAVMRKLLLLARALVVKGVDYDPHHAKSCGCTDGQAGRAAENGPVRNSSSEAALPAYA